MAESVAVEVLNDAFQRDPAAIDALIINRVPCNQALADHPEVIVEQNPVLENGGFTVGALGLLNGVLTALAIGKVAVMISEPDADGRSRVVGFCDYVEPQEESTEVFQLSDLSEYTKQRLKEILE